MQKAGRKDPFGALRWGTLMVGSEIPPAKVANQRRDGGAKPQTHRKLMVDFNYQPPSRKTGE